MSFHPSPELAQEKADQSGAHPVYLPAQIRPVQCDSRNPCPDRPRRRLRRFTDQPWRCPQCSRWWVTERHTSYAYPEGFWVWVRAEDAP